MPDDTGARARPDTGPLDDALTRLVRLVRRPRVRRRLTASVAEPLERAQHIVLHRISLLEPVRLSELAAELDVDASTASRQVAQLLADEMVERRPDPDDGRASQLTTTRRGRRAITTMRTARQQALADVVADWSPADLQALVDGLTRLADGLDAPEGT